ncbi:MAG: sugar ABC transporter permease, partial [Actinobacteria bacterium]|nr:sugar ABC transporter permease [Actinomycetota bacterium]
MATTSPAIGSVVPSIGGAGRKHSGSPRRRAAWAGLAFIVPGFALYALVIAYPAVQALLISLRDYKITPGAVSPWIGLDNYVRAVHDPVLLRSFVNAAVYMVATVPTQIVIGLGLAVLLNTALPGRTLFRVLFYLPVVTSWVVVSLLFQYLFATDHGIVNYLLVDVLGVVGEPVNWLGQRWTAMVAISALGVWKGVGWSMLIFLAALTGVPRELNEAAALDGAGAWGRFRHVSLPHIRGTMVTVVILLVIGGFNVFTSVLLMTDGGPLDQTQVPLTY